MVEGVENLYIRVFLEADGGHSAEVVMRDYHTNITHIEKDGKVLLDSALAPEKETEPPRQGIPPC